MVSCNKINSYIQKTILDGIKIPYRTSYPVVYYENDNYYLACFVFFFVREDIEIGKIDRPTVWVIADIETGEIIEERYTKDKDFSDASYDMKYSVRSDGDYDTSEEYYDRAFAILDSVRSKIITDGEFDKREYQNYLDMILANIPKEYQRFYNELSV